MPDRGPVHDPGHAPHRRLYRQCRRALEGAGHGGLRALPGRLPRRAAGGRRGGQSLCPGRQARPGLDPARKPRPHPPDRRDREECRHRPYRLRPRQPPGDDRHPRRTRCSGVADSIPGAGGLPGRGGREARRGRLGLDLRPDPPGRAPGAGPRARRRPYPHPPHLAAAEESRRAAGELRADHRSGNEQGPAQDPAPRPVSGRRPAGEQSLRPALQDRRDRGRDRGGAGDGKRRLTALVIAGLASPSSRLAAARARWRWSSMPCAAESAISNEISDEQDRPASSPPRISPPTRRCAGARAAATMRS